jgi:hypothetical protein
MVDGVAVGDESHDVGEPLSVCDRTFGFDSGVAKDGEYEKAEIRSEAVPMFTSARCLHRIIDKVILTR